MDTLDGTEWDVVISGTGLPQSLLALSLSRSGKKILHIDPHEYYGDHEAALSLTEAEEWAKKHNKQDHGRSAVSDVTVMKLGSKADEKSKLSFSRAYSLALAPQLIYARSNLLPALVSSRTHEQLEFQAVGSWFTLSRPNGKHSDSVPRKLTRVPGGREDVFQDTALDLRAKRSLMKLLRFIASYDSPEKSDEWNGKKGHTFAYALRDDFGLPDSTHDALYALALTSLMPTKTNMAQAVPRIATHLRSVGMFGPGFSAVLPKWGGLAEVAQVACRACAVGGGVYVLNKGAQVVQVDETGKLLLRLSDGEHVRTDWLAGSEHDLGAAPSSTYVTKDLNLVDSVTRSISIVDSSMAPLFPRTSEGGVTPAGAVIMQDNGSAMSPVYMLAHSSESGECPAGQSVVYSSISGPRTAANLDLLADAVSQLFNSIGEDPTPQLLWCMTYTHHIPLGREENDVGNEDLDAHIAHLRPVSTDLVFGDEVIEDVKKAWMKMSGEDEEAFMRFEAREQFGDDETEG